MPKQMYSANDRVKIRAEDGGEKEVTITSVQVGIGDGMDGEAVVVVQDDDMEEYRVLGSTFARALVERVGAAARPARSGVEDRNMRKKGMNGPSRHPAFHSIKKLPESHKGPGAENPVRASAFNRP